ncbi:MAG: PQQ-binding-like beta-propeller repeat protein [Armatimonadetes bacterium]|nr:PQQ-binding-like beta-propeller repeat protein [Armatimonadota bacterium]
MRFSLFCALLFVILATLPLFALEDFSFAIVSDTHVGFSRSNQAWQKMMETLSLKKESFRFVVNQGDITEVGTPESFDFYRETGKLLSLPFYSIPGNHDVCWAGPGKGRYRDFLGPIYHSMDSGGIHFLFLDSTITHQTHGHISDREIAWLKEDLSRVPGGTPLLVFSHHPLKWTGRSVDNGSTVARLLESRGACAFFNGHGHNAVYRRYNGVPFVQSGAAFQGFYHQVIIEGGQARVILSKPDGAEAQLLEFPLSVAPAEKGLAILSPKEGREISGGASFPIKLSILRKDLQGIEYRVDEGKWQPWSEESLLESEAMPAGFHRLQVRGRDGDREIWDDEVLFSSRRKDSPTVLWHKEIGDILASPVIGDGLVYLCAENGRIEARSLAKGNLVWAGSAGGEIIGTPLFHGGRLYVGDSSGKIECLEGRTGKRIWSADAASPLLSHAGQYDGMLLVGDALGKLWARDLETGAARWSFQADGFVKSRPCGSDGRIFFGAWDRAFHSISEEGRELWKVPMGKSIYFSPALSSPAIAGSLVLVSSREGIVYALSREDGKGVWTMPDKAGFCSPLLVGDRIFWTAQPTKLFCLTAEKGESVWEENLGHGFFESSPVMAGGTLCVSSYVGELFGLDPEKGRILWEFSLGQGYVFATPAASGDFLVTGSLDGSVTCLKMRERKP